MIPDAIEYWVVTWSSKSGYREMTHICEDLNTAKQMVRLHFDMTCNEEYGDTFNGFDWWPEPDRYVASCTRHDADGIAHIWMYELDKVQYIESE